MAQVSFANCSADALSGSGKVFSVPQHFLFFADGVCIVRTLEVNLVHFAVKPIGYRRLTILQEHDLVKWNSPLRIGSLLDTMTRLRPCVYHRQFGNQVITMGLTCWDRVALPLHWLREFVYVKSNVHLALPNALARLCYLSGSSQRSVYRGRRHAL